MNRALYTAIQLLSFTGVATLATTGCASHAQTAPVYRESATAGSTEADVREEFDPARFRQDLLLIQPVFTPPEVVATPAAPEPETVAQVLPIADSADVVYRVQVIALSLQSGAQQIAEELQRRFGVPTEVTPQGRLFAVRAGYLNNAADAEKLRSRISALSRGYEGAFLVTDSVHDAAALLNPDSDMPIADLATADMGAGAVGVDSPPVESLPVASPATETDTPSAEFELFRTQGWRVLIGQFMDLAGAQEYRKQVIKRLKREDVDVIFEAPRFKVLAGSFRTSTEAQQFVERCRSLGFRTASKIPGEVYLPREEDQTR